MSARFLIVICLATGAAAQTVSTSAPSLYASGDLARRSGRSEAALDAERRVVVLEPCGLAA